MLIFIDSFIDNESHSVGVTNNQIDRLFLLDITLGSVRLVIRNLLCIHAHEYLFMLVQRHTHIHIHTHVGLLARLSACTRVCTFASIDLPLVLSIQ